MAELITSHRFQLARDCSRLSAVTVPNVRFVTLAASGAAVNALTTIIVRQDTTKMNRL